MANCIQCGRKLPALTFGKKICQWCVQHEAAQRGEPGDDAKQQVMPAPWVRRESSITLTHVLFGANVMVFIAMAVATYVATKDANAVLVAISEGFSGQLSVHFGGNFGPYTLSGDWWRLFTYMFLHSEAMHILFNMWCLWDLGRLCESLYGRWTFAAIYLITGVAGGLASVAWNPGVLSVGASGAIFGLAGALIASFYLGEFSLPSIAIRGTLRSLVFFVGFNVLFGAGFNLFGGGSGGIDNACHFGGLVSGLILGALIARVAPEHDATVRRVGVIALVALAVGGGVLGVRSWRGTPYRFARAFESLSEHQPDRAIAQLQAVVRQQPNFVQAHYALAQAYFSQEKFPQAEAEFKRVLELQPQYSGASVNLGIVYLNENRTEDAKNIFTQVLARDANDADAHYGLGMALAAQNNHERAIEEFKTALKMDPNSSGVNYEMGRSYSKLKMYDEAIAAYLKEREHGDDAFTENALAGAYEAKGMTQKAQEARAKAAQLKSQQNQ